jgi:hypothetical protein
MTSVANGVPAFRPPEARTVRRTLVAMGMILGSLFAALNRLTGVNVAVVHPPLTAPTGR